MGYELDINWRLAPWLEEAEGRSVDDDVPFLVHAAIFRWAEAPEALAAHHDDHSPHEWWMEVEGTNVRFLLLLVPDPERVNVTYIHLDSLEPEGWAARAW